MSRHHAHPVAHVIIDRVNTCAGYSSSPIISVNLLPYRGRWGLETGNKLSGKWIDRSPAVAYSIRLPVTAVDLSLQHTLAETVKLVCNRFVNLLTHTSWMNWRVVWKSLGPFLCHIYSLKKEPLNPVKVPRRLVGPISNDARVDIRKQQSSSLSRECPEAGGFNQTILPQGHSEVEWIKATVCASLPCDPSHYLLLSFIHRELLHCKYCRPTVCHWRINPTKQTVIQFTL